MVVFAGLGGAAGRQMAGSLGAVAGVLLGVAAAAYLYFSVLVQFRARRFVPLVEKERDWAAEFGEVVRAQERLKAVIERDPPDGT